MFLTRKSEIPLRVLSPDGAQQEERNARKSSDVCLLFFFFFLPNQNMVFVVQEFCVVLSADPLPAYGPMNKCGRKAATRTDVLWVLLQQICRFKQIVTSFFLQFLYRQSYIFTLSCWITLAITFFVLCDNLCFRSIKRSSVSMPSTPSWQTAFS